MSFIINILSTPAILVGLISLFGLILQKKPVEDVVKGTVKDTKDFGIFIKLENNLDGLIRNEDLAPLKVEDIKNGDVVEAVIINIDTKKNRIRLSVKRLEQQQEREMLKSVNDDSSMTLGDILKDQIK